MRFKMMALVLACTLAPIALLSLHERLELAVVVVVAPLGCALAWWLGRRMVEPVEALQREVLARAHLAALLRGLVKSLRADLRCHTITFTLLGVDEALAFPAAPRLESALRNIVDNAASFAGANGRPSSSKTAAQASRRNIDLAGSIASSPRTRRARACAQPRGRRSAHWRAPS